MSRTDNTRPLLLQWADSTIKGWPGHDEPHQPRKRAGGHQCGGACGYYDGINADKYRNPHLEFTACVRVGQYYGGKRSLDGNVKYERKQRRRSIRQRERLALHRVKASGYLDDFDLAPKREDCRTIIDDLS